MQSKSNENNVNKEIDSYIFGKYREVRNINSEKYENTEKIFYLKDNQNTERVNILKVNYCIKKLYFLI